MMFKQTNIETGKEEMIDQYEIMFRLSHRKNRPKDISDLMRGKEVITEYNRYKMEDKPNE